MDDSNQSSNSKPEFGKLQSIFWPIHGYELKKFLPMSFLMFSLLFVYTMVRDLKDVFIQHYAVCGSTELIPVLKLWFVMPAAFLSVMLFTFLVNKFGNTKTFYIMVSIFMIFYAIFLFVLFPQADNLHASEAVVKRIRESWPGFFYYIIPCITNWSYTLFYCFSEIWGTIAISSLFWQFANKVTKKSEVKRFYGLYAMIANIGVIISGGTLEKMSKVPAGKQFDNNVKILIGLCIFFGIISMCIFRYVNKMSLKDNSISDVKKNKNNVSVMEGIKILFSSPYMGLVAVLVVAYGTAVNFLEVVWKDCMRTTLVNPNEYASMMGNFSMITGVLTIVLTILSASIIRKYKWKVPALVSPVIMALFGLVFFSLVIYNKSGKSHLLGISVPIMIVWVGLIADALIKSVKYCLFDTTKNMAYRPLDEDTKTKGQAAVEVIAGRTGKAGASTINYVLTSVVSAGSKISSHLFTIVPLFTATVIGWLVAVFRLSNKYESQIKNKSQR